MIKYMKGMIFLKLFYVDILDDCETTSQVRVGNTAKEVENRIWNEDEYSCLMNVYAHPINEIDRYKVVFKKGKKISLEK